MERKDVLPHGFCLGPTLAAGSRSGRTGVSRVGWRVRGRGGLGEKLQEQSPDMHGAGVFKAGSCRGDAGCQEENLPLAIDSLQAQLLLQLHHTHGLTQVLG